MANLRTLANLHFGDIIAEAQGQTGLGKEFLGNYKSYCMNNADCVAVVNRFIKEAQQYTYDKGVVEALGKVCGYINENNVSWGLASVCESIKGNNSQYNFLNKSVLGQVDTLLEMEEEDVKKYIKAGALKNCMFVEGIRNVCKKVFNDRPVTEEFEQYTITHPFSLLEITENGKYFTVGNRAYVMDNCGKITESSMGILSEEYKMIMGLLNSNKITYANESFTYKAPNCDYVICETGKVNRVENGKTSEMTVEQFRENTRLYTNGFYGNRKQLQYEFECIARTAERFDDICNLDNVHIVKSQNDCFVVVETNAEATTAIVESISSRRNSPFRLEGNIFECCNFIKSRCNIDLSGRYSEQINTVCEKEEAASMDAMKRQFEENEISERRSKIMEMVEQYKNDPAKLAVLSKLAVSLNELD